MVNVAREQLVELASHRGEISVSLYLPTHKVGSEKDQDRIRLKNLVRAACARLAEQGVREAEAERLCAPARDLVDDPTFWRSTDTGLAMFISDDEVHTLVLDVPVPETSVVGDRYYLRPLLAAHRGARRFFALAVDRGGCRLFAGDGASIERVDLSGVPASLAEELRYDETQEAVQYSSVPIPGAGAGGGRPTGPMFHGHGGERDVDKSNLERYLRKVEAAVTKAVGSEGLVPLVLLGVEYELALYRSLNTCRSLADEQVTGAVDELSDHDVHARALEALEPRFAAEVGSRLAELADLGGSALTEHDVTRIVSAAAAGRVRALFFDDASGPYGTFDRENDEVLVACADEPRLLRESADAIEPEVACGWDLVDLAAAETLLHGGEVLAFRGEAAPVRGVSAVLRY